MHKSQHQRDINIIIYLEKLIYAHTGAASEDDIATANLGKDTPTEAERLRVLAKYDDGNTNPHHRHWHRQSFGAGVVYLSKPAPFEPF
jgi:hypothetical protein